MIRMIRISKKYYLKQVMACWLMCYMALGIPAQVAMALENPAADTLPTGQSVVAGSVGNFNRDTLLNELHIENIADGTIINWDNHDIGSDAWTNYQFTIDGGRAMSEVMDGDVTGIMGKLTANGPVFLINPAGIVFGKNAVINVPQLVASSLEILDEDFLNGLPYEFTENPDFIGADDGIVKNESSNFQNAKRLYLIGRQVINRGHILADECVIMAAGDRVLISENSPVVVEVEMGDGWSSGDDLYQIRNEYGDGISVDGDTARVVLAAGDIWSAALVTASAGGPEAVATIDIDAAGDVDVIAHVWKDEQENWHGGEALIQAVAWGGTTNTSEILICADGHLTVEAEGWYDDEWDRSYGSTASIEAIANCGYNNNAAVKIGAKEGIEVTAVSDLYAADASASIAAKAQSAENTNTASVVACTEGGVQVIDVGGGDTPHTAKIVAEALYGHTTDAYVGICAVDDVIVAASEDGTAKIKAEAAQYLVNGVRLAVNGNGNGNYEPTSANAEVVVVSHEGDVAVVDAGGVGDTAKIVAEAYNAYSNTAGVGVAAENVTVQALGEGSLAYILAYAHNGMENTADVVVCAPGTVAVISEDGGDAGIEARAEMSGLNTATTQVYASEVEVGEGAYIRASAYPTSISVTDGYCLTDDDKVAWTDGGAVLIIGDYGSRQDCPDCPPCPCEEDDEDFFAPVAPLAQFEIPRIEGCPALTQAAAIELGITAETLQVAIGNALALNPTIQPCHACATLVNAANILRDEDGSRMAAMAQVFNTLAPADAPFTPEMATSIAMAFGGAAEGSQYASVMEYIDAFVQYAAVLDTELGSPVGDSVAFVMGKYGEGVTGSDNGNIAAFVATRLEAIGM